MLLNQVCIILLVKYLDWIGLFKIYSFFQSSLLVSVFFDKGFLIFKSLDFLITLSPVLVINSVVLIPIIVQNRYGGSLHHTLIYNRFNFSPYIFMVNTEVRGDWLAWNLGAALDILFIYPWYRFKAKTRSLDYFWARRLLTLIWLLHQKVKPAGKLRDNLLGLISFLIFSLLKYVNDLFLHFLVSILFENFPLLNLDVGRSLNSKSFLSIFNSFMNYKLCHFGFQ